MIRELICSKVPVLIGREITARAKSRHVTVSAYVAEICRQHMQGGELSFAPQSVGLAAASVKTRAKVSRAGHKGKREANRV